MWSPRPRNRDGTPVDPVPVLVVVLTGFLIVYAWGPLYLGALGFSPLEAAVVLTVVFVIVLVASYYRLVWAYDPEQPRVQRRGLEWILYAIAIGFALMILLAIPFLQPS